ncbi:FadR/GntR family transcriptional regulator [Streptomyces sulphureus]|uniref:FadR/GntR family transcriptional regulator n=1 Tax=Streptomyces sulphureus TaxID=47758 RepID=UPI000563C46A|nr:FCD domain-containing protein [Streptomyces sulphureus]
MSERLSGSRGPEKGNQRLAEKVAELIEQDIWESGWNVGSVVGSESELMERYGVSRAVFREAARLVEHQRMAAMRRGPGGGLVVTEPEPGVVRNAARVYLRHAGVDRRQLFEARMALELAMMTSASSNVTEPGIERLNEALDAERQLLDRGVTRGHARNLHRVIAEVAGNPAVTLFVEVLAQLDQDMVQQKWDEKGPSGDASDEAAQASHEAHRAIVAAIVSGDAALAQHRMRRHLQAITELFEAEP